MRKILVTITLIYLFTGSLFAQTNRYSKIVSPQWSRAKAETWYKQQAWVVGANFIPSTAINQLEMWQASTFDTETIDRSWAGRKA